MSIHDLLPNAPPGFRPYPVAPVRTHWNEWLGRISWLSSPTRAVWVAQDEQQATKLLEVGMRCYPSPAFAKRAWRNPDQAVIATLVDPAPVITPLESNRVLVRWQRGPVHFTEVGAQHGRVIMSCVAAATTTDDVTPILRDLEEQVHLRVESLSSAWLSKMPPRLWQVLVGTFIGVVPLVILNLITGNGLVVGAGFGLILLYVRIPRFRRTNRQKERWRKSLIDGDLDGTVRRALASVGVQIPAAGT